MRREQFSQPARCSFRTSTVCSAAVAGRPRRFPFSRAWASSWSVASRSVTERPQRSSRQTSTTIDLPTAGGLEQFLAACRFAAPEFTSRTCMAIVQPRRAAYSRMARFCIAKVC